MIELVFATNNRHKIEEIKDVVGKLYQITTLEEAGIDIDIPEPHNTLHQNALEKSRTIYKLTGKNCFSEDTGLFVNALRGEPGVKSARYAGEGRNFSDNVNKLIGNLRHISDRSAYFQTVISLILDGKDYFFEGKCPGKIIDTPYGEKGFGYDPVFVPDGETRTFAEMAIEEKNTLSHRTKAIRQLLSFLSQNGNI